MSNDFMRHLNEVQRRRVAAAMLPIQTPAGALLVR